MNEYGKVIEKRIVVNKHTEKNLNLVFTKEEGTYSGADITKYPYKILSNGIEIRDIADLLGPRNIETTENYYISSILESKIKVIKLVEQVINSDT